MSGRQRTGRAAHRNEPRACHFALLVWIVLAVTLLAGCGGGASPPAPTVAPHTDRSAPSARVHASLEGLVWIADGGIWAAEDGEARLVIEADDPWSLRGSRSGEAITFLAREGGHARLLTAVKGDWRAEPIWESELGSLLAEAVHDDVSDMIWFSVSGEATTTIALCEPGNTEHVTVLDLPLAVAPHFAVRFEDGVLIAPGAAQAPARLYLFDPGPTPLFTASSLFSPRLSPDGSRVLVTGSKRQGEPLGLWAVDLERDQPVEIGTGPGIPADPVWSPDGDRVAFRDLETGTVWTAPARGGPAADSGVRAEEGGLAW